MALRTFSNLNPPKKECEYNSHLIVTQPDEAISVREIIERAAAGMDLPVYQESPSDGRVYDMRHQELTDLFPSANVQFDDDIKDAIGDQNAIAPKNPEQRETPPTPDALAPADDKQA